MSDVEDSVEDCAWAGHEWATSEVTLARDGSYVERTCTRCGAVTMLGPDELSGRV